MYRGTTPTLYLELETELDLSNITEMWVTFKSPTVEITKYLSKNEVIFDSELNVVTVVLSQDDTLALYSGEAEVQIRFKVNDLAYATDIEKLDIQKVLKEGVI